jgi:hypothetical protein
MVALDALESLLMEQIAPLQARYRSIAIHLSPPPGVEAVPGETLLDPATLAAHVARFGDRIGTADQRIAAVHWLGQVGYAVLPPIELAMTRAGIGLDAGLANIALLQPAGQPDAVLVRDVGRTVVLPERYQGALPLATVGRPVATAAALRRFVVDGLFGRTFLPLVERLHGLTSVSRQVLWGQVAYEADLFYQQLARVAPEARDADWEADRAALFTRHGWDVAPGESPLYQPTRTVTVTDPASGAPTERTLRATCCLIYRVPTGRMCGACPLAPKRAVVGTKLATTDERRAAHGLAPGLR